MSKIPRRSLLSAAVVVATGSSLSAKSGSSGDYEPYPQSAEVLGDIVSRVRNGRPIRRFFSNSPAVIAQTNTREFFFETRLELIRSRPANVVLPGGTLNQQSSRLSYSNGTMISSADIPYIALPGPGEWLLDLGVQLGDYVALVRANSVAFAVFAEFSDSNRLGQCSLFLMQLLDVTDQAEAVTKVREAQQRAVVIVFPGSGSVRDRGNRQSLWDAINQKGPNLFRIAGGRLELGRVPEQQRRPLSKVTRVLWVDDNPSNNVSETAALRRLGAEVFQVRSTEEAVAAIRENPDWDLIISDLARGRNPRAGIDLARLLRSENKDYKVVLYTSALGRERFEQEARQLDLRVTNQPAEIIDMLLLMSR